MNHIYKTKFASESAYRQLVDQQPEWLQSVESVVKIGTIIKRATFDEDGNELTPEIVVEGYHVDLLGHSLIQELKDYVPDTIPSTPVHGNGWCMGEKFIIVTKANYL